MDKLPDNTVLNKGLTGCGATTLAIQEERDTIIAVPFTALIDNKTANPGHRDVLLGLHGETPDDFRADITAYLAGHPRIKIMTTYDSLPKVCSTLTALGYDPYKRMHLAVDEWHLLMMSYGFRGNTIRNLLVEAKRFKTVTYMSATPIDREYWFPEMQGLKEMKIDWPNARNVRVHKVHTPSPVKTTAMMCMNRIKDGTGPNYHMFMNSVKGISEIIRKAGLTTENCRVVCASTGKNKAKLPEGFTISSANDPVKTINFYTSTCFEGCDLLDENNRTFIICDPNRPTTVLDISTSMLQICGRIRNSRNKGEMTLIYNTTRYEQEASLDLYLKRIEAEIAEAEEDIDWLNNGPDTKLRRQLLLELKEFDAPFILYENGEIMIDQAMIHLDIINYKILHGLFATQVNLDAEFEKNDIKVASNRYDADARYVELMATPRISFKDCCVKYAELKPATGTFSFIEDEQLTRLRYLCPEACNAVDKLGIDTIREMKFQKTNVLRKVASICDDAQGLKIKRELDRRLAKYQAYTVGEIRKVLGEVYQDCGFNKKPVATDLDRWYRFRATKKEGYNAFIIEGDKVIYR